MGTAHRSVDLGADWIAVLEAMHSSEPDEAAWCSQIIEAARPLFPAADMVGIYSMECSPDRLEQHVRFMWPSSHAPMVQAWADFLRRELGDRATFAETFDRYHFASSQVLTSLEVVRGLSEDVAQSIAESRTAYGFPRDGMGVIAHPQPGVVTVINVLQEPVITLRSHERRLLKQIALHLETAHRARRQPSAIVAELRGDGRIRYRDEKDGIAPEAHLLEEHGHRVRQARSRETRRSGHAGDALSLWNALIDGRASLAPRGIGSDSHYVVLNNPPNTQHLRAFTETEAAVLRLAAHGNSTKLIAYALGISAASVSTKLLSAAAKIGVLSRAELVRVAALLNRDPRSELLPDNAITEAEREVLDLLQRGLSNREIAEQRSRSMRTIANQVASLLRKTGSTSRRGLLVG